METRRMRTLGVRLWGTLAIGGAMSLLGTVLVGAGCSSSTSETNDGGTGFNSADGSTTVTFYPDAAPLPGESECKVVVSTGLPTGAVHHVPVCTDAGAHNEPKYSTNPPSGGDHWPLWAAYKEFTTPVPRPMYVHNLEHGGVVLAYRCEADCPDVVALLEGVHAAVGLDPLCAPYPTLSRVILTSDPKLDAPIAAAAWGATYVATCIDKSSLEAFVGNVYGRGPESTCSPGYDIDDPAIGVPACAAADGGGGGGDGGGTGGTGGEGGAG